MNTTNDTLVFQHVHSNSGCAEWIALTIRRTLEYCAMHKMDYRLIVGDREGYTGQQGHWTVPHYIREFCYGTGYKNVIYLDADTIIADMQTDLRDACIADKIGAVWHDLAYHDPDWSHFNAGVLYVSNTPKVRNFMDRWINKFPGKPDFPWWEQGVLNHLGRKLDIINHLDNRWNAGHVSPSDTVVVWGLHGVPDRLETMRAVMEKLEDKQ